MYSCFVSTIVKKKKEEINCFGFFFLDTILVAVHTLNGIPLKINVSVSVLYLLFFAFLKYYSLKLKKDCLED